MIPLSVIPEEKIYEGDSVSSKLILEKTEFEKDDPSFVALMLHTTGEIVSDEIEESKNLIMKALIKLAMTMIDNEDILNVYFIDTNNGIICVINNKIPVYVTHESLPNLYLFEINLPNFNSQFTINNKFRLTTGYLQVIINLVKNFLDSNSKFWTNKNFSASNKVNENVTKLMNLVLSNRSEAIVPADCDCPPDDQIRKIIGKMFPDNKKISKSVNTILSSEDAKLQILSKLCEYDSSLIDIIFDLFARALYDKNEDYRLIISKYTSLIAYQSDNDHTKTIEDLTNTNIRLIEDKRFLEEKNKELSENYNSLLAKREEDMCALETLLNYYHGHQSNNRIPSYTKKPEIVITSSEERTAHL